MTLYLICATVSFAAGYIVCYQMNERERKKKKNPPVTLYQATQND